MLPTPDYSLELRYAGPVAGVDEVGRGPLAGPVVAAAVILNADAIPHGLNDSKELTARQRAALLEILDETAHVGIGCATVAEIDRINILRASHLAMCRAVDALPRRAAHVLIDGHMIPNDLPLPATAIVKGDHTSASIAAASIVAKQYRDALMVDLAQQCPGYGWERNAGYPTREHLDALRNIGATPHHRVSFKPVHNILYQEKSVTG